MPICTKALYTVCSTGMVTRGRGYHVNYLFKIISDKKIYQIDSNNQSIQFHLMMTVMKKKDI